MSNANVRPLRTNGLQIQGNLGIRRVTIVWVYLAKRDISTQGGQKTMNLLLTDAV